MTSPAGCRGERLRFEALSTCGGLYGRLDLAAELDGATAGRGTTNVDINPPLYESLTRVGGADPLRLSVGERVHCVHVGRQRGREAGAAAGPLDARAG